MAKFLANENVPADAVMAARQAGHDITWIKDVSPGSDDDSVLARSVAEARVLITFDKDVGEMTFRRGKLASCGIILFRPRLRSPQYLARFVVEALSQPVAWEAHFSVAQEGRVRVLPLP